MLDYVCRTRDRCRGILVVKSELEEKRFLRLKINKVEIEI